LVRVFAEERPRKADISSWQRLSLSAVPGGRQLQKDRQGQKMARQPAHCKAGGASVHLIPAIWLLQAHFRGLSRPCPLPPARRRRYKTSDDSMKSAIFRCMPASR